MTRWASREAIEDAILHMDTGALMCRSNNHAWQAFSAPFSRTSRTYDATQQCIRCLSFRHAEISEGGAMLKRWSIAYSDGYLLKGLGRAAGEARDALRFAAVVRNSPNAPARHRKRAG